MVLITHEQHTTPLVALQIFVRAGSLYEGEYLGTGISHFVEHVIDDGTQRRTRQQIDTLVEALGNDSNAYTWRDHTKYYITTTPEQFPEALDVLADYVQHAIFPVEEVETQRGVILHELNKDEDEPERRLHTLFYETLYRVHPARLPVGGYRQAFEKLTRDDLLHYYQQIYVPDNTVVVVSGDFDTDQMQAQVSEAFGGWDRRAAPAFVLPQEPPQIAPRRAMLKHDVAIASLMVGFPTVDMTHPDTYPLDMIALILGGGESARLHHLLCEQKQIAYSVDVWSESPSSYPGVLGVEAELEAENLETAEHLIREQLDRLRVEPVSESELARAKTLAESEYLFGLQTVEDIAGDLGQNELSVGTPEFSELYLERLKAVTLQDVQHAANAYLRPDCTNTCILQSAKSLHRPKASGAQPSIQQTIPKARVGKHVLENGLRVLIARDDKIPIVAAQAAFLGGVRAEEGFGPIEEVSGLSSFMTKTMLRETRHHSSVELASLIESVGGNIDGFSGHHSFGVTTNVLARELPLGLSLLADVLRNPTFAEREVKWVRKHQLAQIRSENDDWMAPAQRLFQEALFRHYSYRFRAVGTRPSIKHLSAMQLKQFHAQYCNPSNMVLAVYGDIVPNSVLEQIELLFGDWRPHPVQIPPAKQEPYIESPRYVEKTREMVQAVLLTGFLTVPCSSPEQYTFQVLNAVLSGLGYPAGRVHNRLRQQQLVYNSFAYNRFGPDTGFFALCGVTTPDKLEDVQSVICEELERLKSERVGEEELERAKNMCIVNHQSDIQTVSERAGVAVLDELYGLGHDYSERFTPNIQRITSEEIQRIACYYLDSQRQVTTVLRPKR